MPSYLGALSAEIFTAAHRTAIYVCVIVRMSSLALIMKVECKF